MSAVELKHLPQAKHLLHLVHLARVTSVKSSIGWNVSSMLREKGPVGNIYIGSLAPLFCLFILVWCSLSPLNCFHTPCQWVLVLGPPLSPLNIGSILLVRSQLSPYSLPMSPWSWTLLVPSQHWCHPPCPPSTVQLIKLLERRLSSSTLLTRPGVYLLCGKLHLYIEP